MRKRIRLSSFIIALLFLLLSSGAVLAGSNTHAGITIDFNSTTSGDDGENIATGVGPDQPVRIDVYAHDVVALKCFEFDLVIDTSKVDYLSVAFAGAITFEPNILDGAVAPVYKLSGDTLSVAYANDTTSDGANGDGLLAEITIRTKSDFTTSTEAYFTIISAVYQDINDSKDHILDLNTYHIDGAINPADTIPPDAVSDLVATPSATDSTITLTWSDPGGGAVTCLFKYSTSPIDNEAEWEDATLLANADFQGGVTPTPSAGTATVVGLPEGDYYFAMKTMDSTPNVSSLIPPTTYTISGTVGLADNPVDSSGSVVCIGSLCDTTNAHGAYSISDVSGGTYEVVATHTGYYPDTATVTVSSDTTVDFTLIGIPSITVYPGALAFDSVEVGSSSSLKLYILNAGRGFLAVDSISSTNSVFTTDFTGPDTLGPGDTTEVNVTFTPDVNQDEMGSLSIFNSDHLVTVSLSGTGIAPAIRVEPESLDFGEVTLGQSFTLPLTLYNDGNAVLVIDSTTYPEAYSGNVNSTTIAPGDSLVDSVTFTPPDTFTYIGVVSIYNNAEFRTVLVVGKGTPRPVPKIVVNPTSLAFEDVEVGGSKDLSFTIHNIGGATLEVTDINPPEAYTVSDTSYSIEPNDSAVVTVTFAPPDTHSYTGSIEIINNDVDKTVDVSGRGIIYDVGIEVVSCPDTVYRNQPDTAFIDLINFGNVTAEEIQVIGRLRHNSTVEETTLFTVPSLLPGATLHMDLEVFSEDTASYSVIATLCAHFAEDSNPANDCDSCSFFYEEVPIRRMGPELPQTYSLSQNYPNPFNPLTQIEYSIPRPSWVRLEVYNILGERVAILVDREQQPGNYRIGWDAGDLRSGVYFCRMEAGSFTFTRRMVLLK